MIDYETIYQDATNAAWPSPDEVMLPYLIVNPTGQTLYSVYQAREQAALTIGASQ